MDTKFADIFTLYKLFFGKKLVGIGPVVAKKNRSRGPTNVPSAQPQLTPISKAIYNATSPKSKPYILASLLKDNVIIEHQELISDESDPDYQEKMENNGLGFFMEDFVSKYGYCPVCGTKSLRRYSHSNVPVVDLVCVNTEAHLLDKCFLFQVKISLTNNYFDLNAKTISVGSKFYGEIPHTMTGLNSKFEKIIVPGYICIKLNGSNLQGYRIDHRNSFVLVPNYKSKLDESYYGYVGVNMYGKNMITWTDSMVQVLGIESVLGGTNKIVYEPFNGVEIDNPYEDLVGILNVSRKLPF